ncbi:hypothetical protein ACLKA6_018433 [Drosophila palustris]
MTARKTSGKGYNRLTMMIIMYLAFDRGNTGEWGVGIEMGNDSPVGINDNDDIIVSLSFSLSLKSEVSDVS